MLLKLGNYIRIVQIKVFPTFFKWERPLNGKCAKFFEGGENLPGNRDNHTEGFEEFLYVWKTCMMNNIQKSNNVDLSSGFTYNAKIDSN